MDFKQYYYSHFYVFQMLNFATFWHPVTHNCVMCILAMFAF